MVYEHHDDIQEPELKDLVKRLPETVLRSRADATSKKYLVDGSNGQGIMV